MTDVSIIEDPAALERLREEITARRRNRTRVIAVCAGTGCVACGCGPVIDALREEVRRRDLEDTITIRPTGCPGVCEMGPVATVQPEGILYQKLTPRDIPELVERTLVGGEVIDRLLYEDPDGGEPVVYERDLPFYRRQVRTLLDAHAHIDPTSIEDYIAHGGYASAAKALLEMGPDDVIDAVTRSGLRGRGGGGFPTGRKWQSCRDASGEPKYVMCNADEGDPGAFMDRSLLEGNPHAVIEGMIIGARAVGATEGYVYVRNEYPIAVQRLALALEQARAHGLLGENILGSGLSFDIRINRGGGAFVCGESTALMASLEGKVGEPRAKYIHTVVRGLWERPSLLNNVETWANVPGIIDRGWEWFRSIGTERAAGTKVFSLVGKIRNTGLVEVPLGITLREILFDIGGGPSGRRPLKAVQTGGPSGGCIPVRGATEPVMDVPLDRLGEAADTAARGEAQADPLDLPVDYDTLVEVGSMMGSGGMIVMDEDTCMVDVALYFVRFLEEESCGKCTPCREGLMRMREILERITTGHGHDGDIEALLDICDVLEDTALCALGGSAPNPVRSTIRYFRDEYEAHIAEHRCPAGVCKELITYSIDAEKCTGCLACVRPCPTDAIEGAKKQPHTLDAERCIKCGACYEVCRFDAVIRS